MNHQQARIWAYLEEAADQFQQDGIVDTVVTSNLAASGYDLSRLPNDIEDILATR